MPGTHSGLARKSEPPPPARPGRRRAPSKKAPQPEPALAEPAAACRSRWNPGRSTASPAPLRCTTSQTGAFRCGRSPQPSGPAAGPSSPSITHLGRASLTSVRLLRHRAGGRYLAQGRRRGDTAILASAAGGCRRRLRGRRVQGGPGGRAAALSRGTAALPTRSWPSGRSTVVHRLQAVASAFITVNSRAGRGADVKAGFRNSSTAVPDVRPKPNLKAAGNTRSVRPALKTLLTARPAKPTSHDLG